jgi:hypothetical protein
MKTLTKTLPLISIALLLSACDDDGSDALAGVPPFTGLPETVSYEVSVQNLTLSQPFSPVALVAHSNDYTIFSIGESASVGLEQLAEGGDPSAFISEAEANGAVVATGSADGILPPGSTEVMEINFRREESAGVQLSAVTML